MFNKSAPNVVKPALKPNFINSQQAVNNANANSAAIQAKLNNISPMSMVVDKLARPTISAGLGLIYTRFALGLPVMNSYGIQKALMYGLSSVVADYLGNFIFDTAQIKKQLGIFDVEDIVVESVLAGGVYALLNRYYMGVKGRVWMDVLVGSASNGIAGVSANFLKMSF